MGAGEKHGAAVVRMAGRVAEVLRRMLLFAGGAAGGESAMETLAGLGPGKLSGGGAATASRL